MTTRAAFCLVVILLLIGFSSTAAAETLDGKRIIIIIIIGGDTEPFRASTQHLLAPKNTPDCYRHARKLSSKLRRRTEDRVAREIAVSRAAACSTYGVVRSGKLDRHRRTLADLITTIGDAGSILVKEGLAVSARQRLNARSIAANRPNHYSTHLTFR